MRHLLLLYLLLCSVFSFSQTSFVKKLPVPHKAVNDFGRFLTSGESDTLETELKNYLKRTSNAIVVVTLESLTDPETEKEYTIEEAALLYFNTWGVGDKVKNNGVLLMVSRNPRKVRIQVGTGLETILSNEICQEIVDNKLVPDFKQGLFYAGIKQAVIAIEQRLDNPPAVDRQNATAPYLRPTVINSESVVAPYEKRSPVIGFLIIGGIVVVCILFFKYGRPLSSGFYSRDGYTSRSSRYNNSFHSYSSGSNWSSGGSSFSSGGSSYGGGSSSGGGASGSW